MTKDHPHATRFIQAGLCRCKFFLHGESGMNGFVCGAPIDEGKSFCDEHHRVVFQPLPDAPPRYRINDYSVGERNEDTDHEPDLTEMLS
ncbi:hypothetical protein [Rhodopseudomonas palustris]|uniref:hypothetical protein n=1 Tax=Rhodopseudomonas palustris TaxID=1076 RepID=UPI000641E8CE|nr:hypothetical protein [Rhodopseudomonas palustris]